MSDMACVRCSRPLVQQRAWQSASRQQRVQWNRDGIRMLQAHGLCASCYQGARKRGDAPRTRIQECRPAPVRCTRCGMPSTPGLCRDCLDVAADLGETERWSA